MAKGKIIAKIVMVVVAIVLVISVLGGMSEQLKTAGHSISDANNCSEATDTNFAAAGAVYNHTDGYCYNTTANGGGKGYLAKQYDLPINTLFGANGAVLFIIMAFMLLFIVFLALKGFKK